MQIYQKKSEYKLLIIQEVYIRKCNYENYFFSFKLISSLIPKTWSKHQQYTEQFQTPYKHQE